MALRLVRRHLKDCPHTSTGYRRCKCPIHVYGTLAGQKIRRALDRFLPWCEQKGLNGGGGV